MKRIVLNHSTSIILCFILCINGWGQSQVQVQTSTVQGIPQQTTSQAQIGSESDKLQGLLAEQTLIQQQIELINQQIAELQAELQNTQDPQKKAQLQNAIQNMQANLTEAEKS